MPSSEVFTKFGRGELHSGGPGGPVVTNRKQAIAIKMSEARKEKKHHGVYPEGHARQSSGMSKGHNPGPAMHSFSSEQAEVIPKVHKRSVAHPHHSQPRIPPTAAGHTVGKPHPPERMTDLEPHFHEDRVPVPHALVHELDADSDISYDEMLKKTVSHLHRANHQRGY